MNSLRVVGSEAQERDTQPPGAGPPPLCPALEGVIEEIGFIRETVEWQTEVLGRIAKAMNISRLPPPPRRPKRHRP